VLWNEGRIRISKRWSEGKDGADQNGGVGRICFRCHPVLAAHLALVAENKPPTQRTGTSYSLPSKARGHVPLSASIFVADHLKPAAKRDGSAYRRRSKGFGLHNLRHSLSNWLVNNSESRTQDRAEHPASREDSDDARPCIRRTTGDETRTAAGGISDGRWEWATQMVAVKCGSVVGWDLWEDAR